MDEARRIRRAFFFHSPRYPATFRPSPAGLHCAHFFRPLSIVFALSALLSVHGQQNDIPLQRDFYIDVERNAAKVGERIHTGLKPLIQSRADLTNVMGHRIDTAKYYYWLTEKIFKEHLLEAKGEDFQLTADPLFQFEAGYDLGDPTVYSDTNRYRHSMRGFFLTGDLGSKISFYTMFQEHQALVPQYQFLQASATGVVSGQGRVKYKARRILDYGWSQGNVSYTPMSWLNVQFGHGKHFVGHGYRSVLLSDHAVNAPFLKFSAITNNKRMQYSTWVSKLQSGVQGSDRLPTGQSSESIFYWMHGRFNHLSVDLGRVQIGLFESTIFENIDSNGVRPFDKLELNPVIGVNTLVRGFDGTGKSLVGLDLRVKLTDKGYLYGQFATDGPDAGRYAYQAGMRWFDVLRKDLHIQLEYNAAEPFMYMNGPAKLAYVHTGLPLAHPMGSYFTEMVAVVDAGFGRIIGQAKVVLANYHRDRTQEESYGGDLLKPDLPVAGPDGPLVHELFYYDANVNYLFNPHTNLRAVLGVQRRSLSEAVDNEQSTYIYFGVRTGLFNRYYDL